jgi:hypothetical protein
MPSVTAAIAWRAAELETIPWVATGARSAIAGIAPINDHAVPQ